MVVAVVVVVVMVAVIALQVVLARGLACGANAVLKWT